MEIEEIIRDIYPMSDEGVSLLRPLLHEQRIKANTLMIRQGHLCREVFFVKSGVARNYTLCDGKEYTRWFAMDGDLLTSMFSFSRGLPAVASVEALTDMEVYTADIDKVKELIVNSPEWALWTSQYLIDGLYIIERRYTFLGQGDAYARYTNLQKMRSAKMLNFIPLQDIASYLGITPQTLSRVRRRIAEEEMGKSRDKGGK